MSVAADPELDDYDFARADILLRIAASSHGSSIHQSAKTLATLFNWQQMPDELESEGQQRAIPISTSGHEASVHDLLEGRAELAIVRADIADGMHIREEENDKTVGASLRLVTTHQPEFLHIIVRSDFEGVSVKSLEGKRVNIGGASSLVQRGIPQLLAEAGCSIADMETFHAPTGDALRRLDEGLLDAVVFFDQAPSQLVASQLTELRYRLLPYQQIPVEESKQNNANAPGYFSSANSGQFYQTPETVNSLLAATYLLTRSDVTGNAIDPVVQLLSVKPELAAAMPAKNSGEQNQNPRHKPFQVSESYSPIPLHSSSQLLIDIFSDPQVVDNPAADAVEQARSDGGSTR